MVEAGTVLFGLCCNKIYVMRNIFFAAGIALCISACNSDKKAAQEAQERALDSMRIELAKQQAIDSMNEAAALAQKDLEMKMEEEKKAAAAASSSRRSSGGGGGRSSGGNSYTTNNYNNTAPQSPNTQTTQQRKGWSSKATGAAIGAGVGAIGGAVLSEKKGAGAVIGGLGGAAVGLGTGAIIDAEKKKKAEREAQQR
jgi:hypothetical protein